MSSKFKLSTDSIKFSKYKSIVLKNTNGIKSFLGEFYKKWPAILGENEIEFNGKKQKISYSYYRSRLQIIGAKDSEGKLKGFVTRAFSHTGPRRGKNFSISSDAFQIARMMKGMQDKTLLIGNLESVRVVVDVRDTVNAYYLAMIRDNCDSKIFNVCGDTPHKMQYFADKLIELSGLNGITQKIHAPFYRPIDIHYQHGDSDELTQLTGWTPTISLDQTLDDLLKYWCDKIS